MTDATNSVRVTPYDSNGTWIIALAGEHDIATSSLLAARTQGVWPHCSVAIVDLSAATFIDSSFVNWLVRARRTLEARGSSDGVRIVEDPQGNAVKLVLDTLAVRDEFATYATAQDALAGEDRRVRSSVPGRVRLQGDVIRKIGKPGTRDAPRDMRLAMRMHPYRRSALLGVAIGLIFGAAFYIVMRLTGHHANGYLLVAIVALSLPGSVLISVTTESAAVDGRDWERNDPHGIPPDAHADAPLEGAEQADHERADRGVPSPQ